VPLDVNPATLQSLRRMLREEKTKTRKIEDIEALLALKEEKDFPHRGRIECNDPQPNRTTGQVRVECKDYKENKALVNAESQSGTNYLVGFQHMLRFGNDRHYLRGGYQFDYDDTRGRNYTYVGHRFLVSAQYTLPWYDVRLAYDFDLHYRNYLHANTVLPVTSPGTTERSDHEYTNIARRGAAAGSRAIALFVTGEYTGKIANSNIDVFQYRRNFGAIYLTWRTEQVSGAARPRGGFGPFRLRRFW
jgi:hypothetical protein